MCDGYHGQQGGDVAAADAGVRRRRRRRRRRVLDGQPNRRLLAVRGDGLAAGPAAAGGLRHRVRAQRAGRQGRAGVRGDGPVGPRPREPVPWHAPARRHPGGPAVDRVRVGHGHPAERGAAGEQLQDDRRARRARARGRRRRVHHAAVRVERDHPQRARARLRAGGERRRAVVADALRVAHAVGRRRHLAVRRAGRVGGPLRAVAVRGRAGGRHHGVHRHHRVQQLLRAPRRGDAAGRQRRVPARLRDAGHHRLQPVRPGAGAADAPLPTRLLPHRQQRLHVVGDVRHRRQRRPHHQQPGQPLHRAGRPQRQGGDEAGGDGGGAVGRVELADGGRHDGERRLLRAFRRGDGGHLRQGLQHRPQVVRARRRAHAERRRPRRPQVRNTSAADGWPPARLSIYAALLLTSSNGHPQLLVLRRAPIIGPWFCYLCSGREFAVPASPPLVAFPDPLPVLTRRDETSRSSGTQYKGGAAADLADD
jgi:hypothetical protein